MTQRFIIGIVAVLLVMSLFVTGCGFIAQKAVEQATGTQIDKSGQSITIKGKDGESLVMGGKIPDELKNFPVAPGFAPEAGFSVATGGDKGVTGVWKGKGDVAQIAAFYKKELTSQGWTEAMTMDSSAAVIRQYTKGDDSAMVTIGKEEKTDNVAITIILAKTKGGPAGSSQTPAAASSQPAAPATNKASDTGSSGPPTTDVSNLPAELKDITMPNGFAPIKDTIGRRASGGKFVSASANWYGKGKTKDIVEFFQKNLPSKGWEEEESHYYEESGFVRLLSKTKNQSLDLTINAMGDGLEIMMDLQQQ